MQTQTIFCGQMVDLSISHEQLLDDHFEENVFLSWYDQLVDAVAD